MQVILTTYCVDFKTKVLNTSWVIPTFFQKCSFHSFKKRRDVVFGIIINVNNDVANRLPYFDPSSIALWV